jgi:type I restriction enzyme S subunit
MKLHSDTYDSYKQAEGEWSDAIPSEWQEKRVKDLFRLVTQAAPANNDYELLSLFAGIGVKPRKDMEARGNKASSTDGYWIVKKNDIVVNKLLAWMGSVGISEYDGVTSPAYDVLRQIKPDIDPRYYSYLFRTETAKKIFRKNSRGIMDMRLRLYFDKLGALTVPVPSYNEQKSIANYLNVKLQYIEHKMDLLNRKKLLYKKLRQAVIDRAVFNGISIKMDVDNYEGNEEVPQEWKIQRIKEVSELNKRSLSSNTKSNYEFEYLDIGGVTFGSKEYETEVMTFEKSPSRARRIVRKGDTIVSTVRTYLKAIMSFTYDIENLIVSTGFAVISPKKSIIEKYCSYYLSSTKVVDEICSLSKGVSYPAISSSTLGDIFFLVPPLDQQIEIVSYLDKKTHEFDCLISKVDIQLNKLKELRIAMVNDAVLGKIKIKVEDIDEKDKEIT